MISSCSGLVFFTDAPMYKGVIEMNIDALVNLPKSTIHRHWLISTSLLFGIEQTHVSETVKIVFDSASFSTIGCSAFRDTQFIVKYIHWLELPKTRKSLQQLANFPFSAS